MADDRAPRTTIAERVARWIEQIRTWDQTLPPGKGPLGLVLVSSASDKGEELGRVDASREIPATDIAARVEVMLFDLAGDAIDLREGWSAKVYAANDRGERITGGLAVRVTTAHRDASTQSTLARSATGAPSQMERASFLVASGFVELQRETIRAARAAHDEIARRDEHHRELLTANVKMADALGGALAIIVAQSQSAVKEAHDRAMAAEAMAREATARALAAEAQRDEAIAAVEKSAEQVEAARSAVNVVGGVVANVMERNGVKLG